MFNIDNTRACFKYYCGRKQWRQCMVINWTTSPITTTIRPSLQVIDFTFYQVDLSVVVLFSYVTLVILFRDFMISKELLFLLDKPFKLKTTHHMIISTYLVHSYQNCLRFSAYLFWMKLKHVLITIYYFINVNFNSISPLSKVKEICLSPNEHTFLASW